MSWTCLLATGLGVALVTQGAVPPRLRVGGVPEPMRLSTDWAWDFLEISIGTDGGVAAVRPLGAPTVYTDPLRAAVAGWRFTPATAEGRVVAWRALLVSIFRPPQLYSVPGMGDPPPVPPAAAELPVPLELTPPVYPPNVRGDGVVLVEIDIAADGRVAAASIRRSWPGFDAAAVGTTSRWRFEPALRDGQATETTAYAIIGFREPVVARSSPRRMTPLAPQQPW